MQNRQHGFTLIEAMVSMVILSVGLMAVTNLMIVAGSSNAVGNQGTAAAAEASLVMERLKAIRFVDLVAGGSLTANTGTVSNCNVEAGTDCVIAGNFHQLRTPLSTSPRGTIALVTRWTITFLNAQSYFIRVRSESTSPLTAARTRAEFTTIRACTATDLGCP